MPLVVLALIVLVVVATGVGYVAGATGPTHYACLTISRQGSNVQVTTSGLLHYDKSQYYISCNEGSNLPTGQYRTSCLTVSPKTVTPNIGLGASTQYYYLSAPGNSITIKGVPTPTNTTEIITPSAVSISVTC